MAFDEPAEVAAINATPEHESWCDSQFPIRTALNIGPGIAGICNCPLSHPVSDDSTHGSDNEAALTGLDLADALFALVRRHGDFFVVDEDGETFKGVRYGVIDDEAVFILE